MAIVGVGRRWVVKVVKIATLCESKVVGAVEEIESDYSESPELSAPCHCDVLHIVDPESIVLRHYVVARARKNVVEVVVVVKFVVMVKFVSVLL